MLKDLDSELPKGARRGERGTERDEETTNFRTRMGNISNLQKYLQQLDVGVSFWCDERLRQITCVLSLYSLSSSLRALLRFVCLYLCKGKDFFFFLSQNLKCYSSFRKLWVNYIWIYMSIFAYYESMRNFECMSY